MSSEILAVPEYHLQEVIDVIRAGLHALRENISKEVKEQLTNWCDEEEEYLNQDDEDEEEDD